MNLSQHDRRAADSEQNVRAFLTAEIADARRWIEAGGMDWFDYQDERHDLVSGASQTFDLEFARADAIMRELEQEAGIPPEYTK